MPTTSADQTQGETPQEILTRVFQRAAAGPDQPIITDSQTGAKIDYVVRNIQNRSGARMLLSCSLAKAHRPEVDIRKPYTEIPDLDAFSGRAGYDERYIDEFVREHSLPCNPTTAWLTPAWRNIKAPLTRDVDLVGRPRAVYKNTIDLLNDVYENKYSAEDLLTETVRRLLILRNEEQLRMESLVTALGVREDALPLSAENIITLIQQHLASRRASRLPVLIVAAAYHAASEYLSERALALHSHNAADKQTGALGDVEITLLGDNDALTSYEMKDKIVTHGDISNAVSKRVL
jgi:DNA adenine methylase